MAASAVRGKARLLKVAQQAADELGLTCHAHNASPLPEDPAVWLVLYTCGYGRVQVRLWDGCTEQGLKDEITKQLLDNHGRRRGAAQGALGR